MAYCKREMKKYQELGTLKDASKDAYIEALGSINFDPAGIPLPDMSQLSQAFNQGNQYNDQNLADQVRFENTSN